MGVNIVLEFVFGHVEGMFGAMGSNSQHCPFNKYKYRQKCLHSCFGISDKRLTESTRDKSSVIRQVVRWDKSMVKTTRRSRQVDSVVETHVWKTLAPIHAKKNTDLSALHSLSLIEFHHAGQWTRPFHITGKHTYNMHFIYCLSTQIRVAKMEYHGVTKKEDKPWHLKNSCLINTIILNTVTGISVCWNLPYWK